MFELAPLSAITTDACGPTPSRICLDVLRLTGSPSAAKFVDLLTVPLAIVLIIVVAVVVRALLSRAVTRIVVRMAAGMPLAGRSAMRARSESDESATASSRRRARAETIGSVLRSVTSFFVFGVALVEVLGALGVNLTPIVASASVIGLAVGFGAQTLVRDFLSGIFMILEDQLGVGDVIDTGLAAGTVEAVSLRTTKLRDDAGIVWYVRNGEIVRVGNSSQGWSLAVVDVTIAADESITRAREVLHAAASEVWRDERFADSVLAEPAVAGVESLGKDGIVIRVTARTSATRQTIIAREIRERVAAAFGQAGIRSGGA
ncbi:MAG TPA: mechanosensitive ion channel family protein [Mycobacteriales bacterium]|nr:mechanosensitive ion channel family protein [Mycobacteriales bacterium]